MSAAVSSPPEEKLDLRCPYGPKQLLAKVVQQGDYAGRSADGLTFEIACRDCAKVARKDNPNIRRVVHRFNVFGELVESIAQAD